MPSLREIEQTMASLWLNEQARNWLTGDSKSPRPECLEGSPTEILDSVDRKGVALYGGLISYGHRDVLESIYPYCRIVLADNWNSVVENYLLKFPPSHYNFNRLCSKFPEYLEKYGAPHTRKYPFLIDLADFEWLELEKMEEPTVIPHLTHEPLVDLQTIAVLHPVLNPTLIIRNYQFNVLDIGDQLAGDDQHRLFEFSPQRTLVAFYRHPQTHRCRMLEITEETCKILEIAKNRMTYQEMIPTVLTLTPNLPAQQAVAEFLELIEELQEIGVFIGSVK